MIPMERKESGRQLGNANAGIPQAKALPSVKVSCYLQSPGAELKFDGDIQVAYTENMSVKQLIEKSAQKIEVEPSTVLKVLEATSQREVVEVKVGSSYIMIVADGNVDAHAVQVNHSGVAAAPMLSIIIRQHNIPNYSENYKIDASFLQLNDEGAKWARFYENLHASCGIAYEQIISLGIGADGNTVVKNIGNVDLGDTLYVNIHAKFTEGRTFGDWVECTLDVTKAVYYMNKSTGQTVWEKPVEFNNIGMHGPPPGRVEPARAAPPVPIGQGYLNEPHGNKLDNPNPDVKQPNVINPGVELARVNNNPANSSIVGNNYNMVSPVPVHNMNHDVAKHVGQDDEKCGQVKKADIIQTLQELQIPQEKINRVLLGKFDNLDEAVMFAFGLSDAIEEPPKANNLARNNSNSNNNRHDQQVNYDNQAKEHYNSRNYPVNNRNPEPKPEDYYPEMRHNPGQPYHSNYVLAYLVEQKYDIAAAQRIVDLATTHNRRFYRHEDIDAFAEVIYQRPKNFASKSSIERELRNLRFPADVIFQVLRQQYDSVDDAVRKAYELFDSNQLQMKRYVTKTEAERELRERNFSDDVIAEVWQGGNYTNIDEVVLKAYEVRQIKVNRRSSSKAAIDKEVVWVELEKLQYPTSVLCKIIDSGNFYSMEEAVKWANEQLQYEGKQAPDHYKEAKVAQSYGQANLVQDQHGYQNIMPPNIAKKRDDSEPQHKLNVLKVTYNGISREISVYALQWSRFVEKIVEEFQLDSNDITLKVKDVGIVKGFADIEEDDVIEVSVNIKVAPPQLPIHVNNASQVKSPSYPDKDLSLQPPPLSRGNSAAKSPSAPPDNSMQPAAISIELPPSLQNCNPQVVGQLLQVGVSMDQIATLHSQGKCGSFDEAMTHLSFTQLYTGPTE